MGSRYVGNGGDDGEKGPFTASTIRTNVPGNKCHSRVREMVAMIELIGIPLEPGTAPLTYSRSRIGSI